LDQLKAEIEVAFRDLNSKVIALLSDPSLDGLEPRVAEIAVPGSPYSEALVSRVTTLVTNGQYLVLNDPSVETLTIESIAIAGPTMADVTACQVTNALTMKRADQSPTGRPIPVGGTGELSAARFTQSMVLTADGWRHDGIASPDDPVWEGLDACPAA
jgi:hypothetical protein